MAGGLVPGGVEARHARAQIGVHLVLSYTSVVLGDAVVDRIDLLDQVLTWIEPKVGKEESAGLHGTPSHR